MLDNKNPTVICFMRVLGLIFASFWGCLFCPILIWELSKTFLGSLKKTGGYRQLTHAPIQQIRTSLFWWIWVTTPALTVEARPYNLSRSFPMLQFRQHDKGRKPNSPSKSWSSEQWGCPCSPGPLFWWDTQSRCSGGSATTVAYISTIKGAQGAWLPF